MYEWLWYGLIALLVLAGSAEHASNGRDGGIAGAIVGLIFTGYLCYWSWLGFVWLVNFVVQ